MKPLSDLLPVILFFAACLRARFHSSRWLAGTCLGWMIGDGSVPADQAPILPATAVAIIASLVQVATLLVRGRKVDA
jgi:intracellular septation protein